MPPPPDRPSPDRPSPARPSPKDYATDQEVRWCPGCGDYAILKAVQKVFADLELPTHETVFVSGIGCSSRFPYYMATYGFHTIHGRAPAFATGIKLANPALDVWMVTGDGDGLSIGGNHLMHALRRNVDLQILLFNNEIYGLTKGQYSPTSRVGTRTPSSPTGSLDAPVSAAQVALGSGARFVARSVDVQQKPLVEVLKRARAFRGTSFVEIFQNCIVFNDGVFDGFLARGVAAEAQIHVEHGKPLLFGDKGAKGLRVRPGSLALEAVELDGRSPEEAGILVHDETDRMAAMLLAAMEPPMPVALGVLYCAPGQQSYDALVVGEARPQAVTGDLSALFRSGEVWTVE
ncbi:2-oxoacid:ferredoxin oxidoreductase subunit beta [Arenibaculum sp.]|uniref:2-oxoacid:ferredoxin oxidoreductase subunit beta n=1 Tax=Arenibaculum sp. TaxID=2865862 RepID=UPI002E0D85B4|nr:2-oxoacid:ferredoxin oxidoreductase subunit beta [Arenibaculum sp.]